MRTDDTTQDSEETATAFTVSRSSENKALVCKSTNQNPSEGNRNLVNISDFIADCHSGREATADGPGLEEL